MEALHRYIQVGRFVVLFPVCPCNVISCFNGTPLTVALQSRKRFLTQNKGGILREFYETVIISVKLLLYI